MKVIVWISGLASLVPDGISTELLERLCAVYPEGRCGSQGHAFQASLPIDDPRLRRLQQILTDSGYQPWQTKPNARDRSCEYTMTTQRLYDSADLKACEYLELSPEHRAEGLYRTDRQKGVIIIEARPPAPVSYVFMPTWIVVRDDIRRALEAAELRNLDFRPTEQRFARSAPADTWWELRADLVLPPLAPSMTLVHKDHTPFTGDFSKGCLRKDGFYSHPELHYRAEDLARVETFDAAHTWEMFGGRIDEYNRPLVVSNRFYQVCRAHGVTTRWVPVRIDE